MVVVTQAQLDSLALRLLLPIMLLISYALFQYLAMIYARRWREWRVRQLLVASALGFCALISFAQKELGVVSQLNDISEGSIQLTFLLQITIIGKDVLTKVPVRSLRYFLYVANVLIAIDWLTVFLNVLALSGIRHAGVGVGYINNSFETFTLLFVLVFRFHYLSLSSSYRAVLRDRKGELALYAAFALHEVPWMVTEATTGLSWEFVQGVCMRVLLAACVLLNIVRKARSMHAASVASVKASAQATTVRGAPKIAPTMSIVRIGSMTKRSDGVKVALNVGPSVAAAAVAPAPIVAPTTADIEADANTKDKPTAKDADRLDSRVVRASPPFMAAPVDRSSGEVSEMEASTRPVFDYAAGMVM